MSRKSKRIGPPFVRRTHGNSPQDTFRLIVIFETASSRAGSAIPIRGVTAFLLAEVFLRLRLFGEVANTDQVTPLFFLVELTQ